MTILLKKQKNIYFIMLCLFTNLGYFSSDSLAQKKVKKSGGRKTTVRNNNAGSKETKATSSKKSAKEKEDDGKIDISKITKYNCEEFYNQCMNKTCYTNSDGRCSCSKMEKFNKSNSSCQYILDACPAQAQDITKTFARNASNDCRDFALMQNEPTGKNIHNYVAKTLECLKPKCRSKTDNFAGCFDEDNFENRFQICKNAYKDLDDTTKLKSLIMQSFLDYKKKFCKDMHGSLNENGECYLTIGIGRTAIDIKAKKNFKIGESLVCSSKFFNTSMGQKDIAILKHAKNITLASLQTLSQMMSTASSMASSASNNGGDVSAAGWVSGAGGLLGTVSTATPIVTESMQLAMGDFSNDDGGCYVLYNGHAIPLFMENDSVKYELRWSESWNETGLANE